MDTHADEDGRDRDMDSIVNQHGTEGTFGAKLGFTIMVAFILMALLYARPNETKAGMSPSLYHGGPEATEP